MTNFKRHVVWNASQENCAGLFDKLKVNSRYFLRR